MSGSVVLNNQLMAASFKEREWQLPITKVAAEKSEREDRGTLLQLQFDPHVKQE
jgi:hypothetical protein